MQIEDLIVHQYVSTACLHGHHDDCRKQCKFCVADCMCRCHQYPMPEVKTV